MPARITSWPGSTVHLHRVLTQIRALGEKAGVVLDPASPPEMIEYVLHLCGLDRACAEATSSGGKYKLVSISK